MAQQKKKKQQQSGNEVQDLSAFNLGGEEPEPTPPDAGGGDGNGDDGESSYSTDISVEGIRQSSQSAGSDRYLVGSSLKGDGDRVEVRFLDDLRKGKKVSRHDQFPGLKPVTCLKTYGKECPYCNDDIPKRDWYAWNVIDFKAGKVKVAAFKAVSGGIPQQMAAFFAENETICDMNYVIVQTGTAKDRKFQAMPKMRTKAEDKQRIAKAIKALLPKKFDLLDALKPPSQLPKVGEGDAGGGGGEEAPGDEFEINVD